MRIYQEKEDREEERQSHEANGHYTVLHPLLGVPDKDLIRGYASNDHRSHMCGCVLTLAVSNIMIGTNCTNG